MDLLQDFANSYRPASYLCEWIELARRGDKGVQYTREPNTGQETFTIELHRLEHPLRRGLTDDHWREFRKWKWQRLGQQFMALNLGAWFPEL